MAHIIEVPTHLDSRGGLSVIEDILPFEIKRVYYIYDAKGERGGHRHHKSIQALVCPIGQCTIYVDNGKSETTYVLDSPSKLLVVETVDWHTMSQFSSDCVLLVLASEKYNKEDYIDEPYTN